MSTISKTTLRRLRFRKGDIAVVSDPYAVHSLAEVGRRAGLEFNVPIICAPEGIKRVSRKYLLKILGLPEEKEYQGNRCRVCSKPILSGCVLCDTCPSDKMEKK